MGVEVMALPVELKEQRVRQNQTQEESVTGGGGEGSRRRPLLRVGVRCHPAQQGTGALAALAQIGGIATA